MSGGGRPTRPEIGTDALVFFFPIRLTGVFFSRVVFGLGTSSSSESESPLYSTMREEYLGVGFLVSAMTE